MKKNKFNIKKFVKLHTKLNSIAAAGIINVLPNDSPMDKVYKYLLNDCNAAMRWIVEDTFFVEGQEQEESQKETQ